MNITKTNSSCKYGWHRVGRTDMWGWYCPETGEYYLAHDVGGDAGVLASARYLRDGEWQEQVDRGYSYEVVRELLRLGHLTKKTLEQFQQEDGEVWWDQPNYSL